VLSRGDLAAVYPIRVLTELIFALDVGWVLEQAAGTAQVGLDVVEDLVIRLVEPG
jgi:hypothetical protein